jgi:hypothetical protein
MASGQRLQLGTDFYYSMTVNRQTEWQFSPRQRTLQLYQLPEYSTVMALFIPCPDFSSVYSIHSMIDGTMTPVVCALLPRMSQLVYNIFATLLQERMLRLNLPFTPTRAFADFEIVVHNATRQVIPGVTFKGCFFHFTLCILKKRDNRTVNIIPRQWRVQNAFDVQLSYRWYPLDCIEDGFFQVLEDLEDADIPHETQPITHYIAEKWIEGDKTGVESFWNRRTLYKKQHRRMLKWRGSTRIKIYSPSYILSRKYKFPMTSTASKEKPREPFDHVPRSISTLLSCKKDSITEWQTWWHTQIVHLSYLTLDK